MTFIDILAQIFGFVAMFSSMMSFQMRTHKSIMLVQMITAALFAVHYALLHGTPMNAGCILNALAIIRDLIFMNQDKKFCQGLHWTVIFSILMVLCGVISWEGPVSLLFMIAMVFNTVSLSMSQPQMVRKVILFASPLAFTYDLLTGSLGGMVNEALAECSAIIGLIRYRKKNDGTEKN